MKGLGAIALFVIGSSWYRQWAEYYQLSSQMIVTVTISQHEIRTHRCEDGDFVRTCYQVVSSGIFGKSNEECTVGPTSTYATKEEAEFWAQDGKRGINIGNRYELYREHMDGKKLRCVSKKRHKENCGEAWKDFCLVPFLYFAMLLAFSPVLMIICLACIP